MWRGVNDRAPVQGCEERTPVVSPEASTETMPFSFLVSHLNLVPRHGHTVLLWCIHMLLATSAALAERGNTRSRHACACRFPPRCSQSYSYPCCQYGAEQPSHMLLWGCMVARALDLFFFSFLLCASPYLIHALTCCHQLIEH